MRTQRSNAVAACLGPIGMSDLRLRSYHEVSGALFRREAGWQVPTSYGPLGSEVAAVRTGAGMIDFGDRAKIEVRGEDRVAFLDGLVTADMKTLAPGTSAYALSLTEKSRVVGDLRVFAFPDRFVLDVEAAQRDVLLEHVHKHLVSDDVTLQDLGPCDHIEIHGRDAVPATSASVGRDLRGLSVHAFETFPVDRRREAYAARVQTIGEPAVILWGPSGSVEPSWAHLSRAGVLPFGREAYEVLRIEAGVPRVGADMGEFTLALEVAPEGSISFTKGCYLGQEVVARGTYRGHMNRKLLGLRIDADVPPARGDRVLAGEDEVGRVTSGTWSPTLGSVLGLGLLRVDRVSPDTRLFVDRDGWDLRARLHPLPFVAPRM